MSIRLVLGQGKEGEDADKEKKESSWKENKASIN